MRFLFLLLFSLVFAAVITTALVALMTGGVVALLDWARARRRP